MKQPKKPCIGCIYFDACGETTRTTPCNGRTTISEYKKENPRKVTYDHKMTYRAKVVR